MKNPARLKAGTLCWTHTPGSWTGRVALRVLQSYPKSMNKRGYVYYDVEIVVSPFTDYGPGKKIGRAHAELHPFTATEDQLAALASILNGKTNSE